MLGKSVSGQFSIQRFEVISLFRLSSCVLQYQAPSQVNAMVCHRCPQLDNLDVDAEPNMKSPAAPDLVSRLGLGGILYALFAVSDASTSARFGEIGLAEENHLL